MKQAAQGDKVRVNYTGRFEDGTVFDSSCDREPLEFTVGQGQVIPGFEQGVDGMTVGDKKTVNIPADQAYGPKYDEAIMTVGRNEFPPDMEIHEGDMLQLRDPDGGVMMATVTELTDESATLDANHPLAGKDLIFDITLEEIVSPIILA